MTLPQSPVLLTHSNTVHSFHISCTTLHSTAASPQSSSSSTTPSTTGPSSSPSTRPELSSTITSIQLRTELSVGVFSSLPISDERMIHVSFTRLEQLMSRYACMTCGGEIEMSSPSDDYNPDSF